MKCSDDVVLHLKHLIFSTRREVDDILTFLQAAIGLTLSTKKTWMLRQLAPNTALPQANISMDGNLLNNVDTFKYFSSCIDFTAQLDDDIQFGIAQDIWTSSLKILV